MPAKKWTEQQITEASQRIQAGEDRETVALSYGMTWKQLYLAAWKRGLFIAQAEKVQIPLSTLQLAHDRIRRGERGLDVSASLGLEHARMTRAMRRAGLPVRAYHARHRRKNWGATVYRMRCEGASGAAICAELGIPYERGVARKLREHLLIYCRAVGCKVPTFVGAGKNRRLVHLDIPREWRGAVNDDGVLVRKVSRWLGRGRKWAKSCK